LGFLPGSGAQDLGGQIQFLGFVGGASKLLRWKLSAVPVATTPSNKVVAVCCFFLLTVLALLYLPLAGLGGEGMEMDWAWRVDLGAVGVCLLRRVCAAPGNAVFRQLPLPISFRPAVAALG
jgi:hypothetical protein